MRDPVVSSPFWFVLFAAIFLLVPVWAQQRYPAARHGGNYMHNYYIPPAPSSTPWYPCWSPDGKAIAFSMHGSIWKYDLETGVATELTYDRSYHSSPDWSPDGRWIVYTADANHRRIQLHVLDLATGRSHPLTSDEHLYLDPAFSPDGRYIAYVSTKPNGYFNIYIRAFKEGAWAGPPVALTEDHRYSRDRLYFGPWDMHLQPRWTPDGSAIVFLSNRGVALGSGDLWKMRVRNPGMENAERILEEQTLYRTRPDVSPDGKRVLYSSTAGAADQFNHLYVIPINGGHPYKLTFGDHDDFHPRWSPDGETIAYITNRNGLPQLALLETYGGKQTIIRFRQLKWKRPMATLTLRVEDERTGQPTPARVHVVASDGKFYGPSEAYARVGMYGSNFFHTDGESTWQLPPGKTTLRIVKGFEYVPVELQLDLEADKPRTLTVQLKRFISAKERHWYSGSTHVHMNYGGNLRNTPQNLILMAKAEDLDVINSLVANKDNRILDWQYFEPGGGEHSSSRNDPNTILIFGEEYRPPFYGHVFLLGLKDHLISPFTTGYENTAIESLYPSNTDVFRKALKQGAVTGYVHPFGSDADPFEIELGVAKAFPVDAVFGTVHAYEWSTANRTQLTVWHHALNNDLPIVPTGGEDSITDLHVSKTIGSLRTYVHLSGPFNAENWLNALKNGQTFVSSGPLPFFEINDQPPGSSLQLSKKGGNVQLRAEVWSLAPIRKAVIYRNGAVFRELDIDASVWQPTEDHMSRPCVRFEESVPVTESSWFNLYVEGPASEWLDTVFVQGITNAIRVYVGDQPIRNAESARYFVKWIDLLSDLAKAWPWWRTEAEKAHVLGQFEEAKKKFEELARTAQ